MNSLVSPDELLAPSWLTSCCCQDPSAPASTPRTLIIPFTLTVCTNNKGFSPQGAGNEGLVIVRSSIWIVPVHFPSQWSIGNSVGPLRKLEAERGGGGGEGRGGGSLAPPRRPPSPIPSFSAWILFLPTPCGSWLSLWGFLGLPFSQPHSGHQPHTALSSDAWRNCQNVPSLDTHTRACTHTHTHTHTHTTLYHTHVDIHLQVFYFICWVLPLQCRPQWVTKEQEEADREREGGGEGETEGGREGGREGVPEGEKERKKQRMVEREEMERGGSREREIRKAIKRGESEGESQFPPPPTHTHITGHCVWSTLDNPEQ